jgi:hypothetical protein
VTAAKPVLTWHSFSPAVDSAILAAAWHEMVTYPGREASTVIVLALATRELRWQLPYASHDGLMTRIAAAVKGHTS